MPNLIAYNPSTPISNAIQFGTIVIDVNNSVNRGSLTWCPSFNICNNYVVITDSYTLGKTNQASARPVGYASPDALQSSLTSTISRISQIIGDGPISDFTTAISYSETKGFFIVNQDYPAITTNGLILDLDAGLTQSYPQTGSSWIDVSAGNHNGTLNNSPTWAITGILGSFTFNGTNQDVSCGNFLPAEYTKLIFFKINNLSNNNSLICGPTHYFGMNGGQTLIAGNGNIWSIVSSNTLFNTGQWYCGAVTYSSANGYRLYVNGTLEDQSGPSTGATLNDSVYIGSFLGSNYFNGEIGISLMYNRELTSSEIFTTYSALFPRFNNTYTDPCATIPSCNVTETCTLIVNATNTFGYIWQIINTTTSQVGITGTYDSSSNNLVDLPKRYLYGNIGDNFELRVINTQTLSYTVFDSWTVNCITYRYWASGLANGPTGSLYSTPTNQKFTWEIYNQTTNTVLYTKDYNFCTCEFQDIPAAQTWGSSQNTIKINFVDPINGKTVIKLCNGDSSFTNTGFSLSFPSNVLGCFYFDTEIFVETGDNTKKPCVGYYLWRLVRKVNTSYTDVYNSGKMTGNVLTGLPSCYKPKQPSYQGDYKILILETNSFNNVLTTINDVVSWTTVGVSPTINFPSNTLTSITGPFTVAPTFTPGGPC
jgi:hypothetical protein